MTVNVVLMVFIVYITLWNFASISPYKYLHVIDPDSEGNSKNRNKSTVC